MASYMFFHVLPDSHIEFLSEHPDTFRSYLEGSQPRIRKSLLDRVLGRKVDSSIPEDWPQGELEGYCPEINHRQVECFHYLLNGTRDRVEHSGCVFQTWFAPRARSVAVTIDGENFALESEFVPSLGERIRGISEDELFRRYAEAVDDASLDTVGREFLLDAFRTIVSACDSAIEKRQGLMWTAG